MWRFLVLFIIFCICPLIEAAQLKDTIIDNDLTIAASGTILSNTDLIMDLDNDNNGSESFQIRDGGDTIIVEVPETGVITSNGLTMGANENITLGSETLDHNGTDFVFSDSLEVATDIDITGATPNQTFTDTDSGEDDYGFHVESDSWVLRNSTSGKDIIAVNVDTITKFKYVFNPCAPIENLAAADDNMTLGNINKPRTIKSFGCKCIGTCTTPAQISLEDEVGNAMTHPTFGCNTSSNVMTYIAITAGGSLDSGESLFFDVDNSVSPETDTYEICFEYIED